jgi:hypothetical protein
VPNLIFGPIFGAAVLLLMGLVFDYLLDGPTKMLLKSSNWLWELLWQWGVVWSVVVILWTIGFLMFGTGTDYESARWFVIAGSTLLALRFSFWKEVWGRIWKERIVAIFIVCGSLAALTVWWCWFVSSRQHPKGTLPGFSVHVLIRLQDGNTGKRQYLFDLGDRGHTSAYISPAKVFTFSILDAQGELYELNAPLETAISLGKLVYLTCDAGYTGTTSTMRILADGQVVASRELPLRVDLSAIHLPGGTLGTDRDQKNGASFTIYGLAIYDRTLTDEEMTNNRKYFMDIHHLHD